MAYWLIEEKHHEEAEKKSKVNRTLSPGEINSLSGNLAEFIWIFRELKHDFEIGLATSTLPTPSTSKIESDSLSNTNSLPSRLRYLSAASRRTGSESDRPDSGFDSKDDGGLTIQGIGPPDFSGESSPEVGGGEILRQAALRQPIFRKKRGNHHSHH